MSWKETAVIEVPSPNGGDVARLEPVDTLTWGPIKAEWSFTVYRLKLGEKRIDGLYTGDAVWDAEGRYIAAVQCRNYAPGSSDWNYAPEDWQPELALMVIDPGRSQIGLAAHDPQFGYQPLKFEGTALVYNKSKHGPLSSVLEMEIDTQAIKSWDPI